MAEYLTNWRYIMKGFLNFIREQGVMGLAVGFILGGNLKAGGLSRQRPD